MKNLKKVVVFIAFAMIFALSVDVQAARMNTPETIEWGKTYSVSLGQSSKYGQAQDEYYEYNMVLNESGKVVFVINETKSGGSTDIVIYDEAGQEVCYTQIKYGLNNWSAELLAGNYTVKVQETWYANTVATIQPNFYPSGETTSENYMSKNNQLGTATAYTVGSSVKAHFAENDDTDVYQVSISKPGYLKIDFTSNISQFRMSIVSTDGEISYSQGGIPLGASSYNYFVPKGTYYISFTQDGYKGTYSFKTKLSGLTVTKTKSIKNLKGKKAKVTWTKKKDVDGYQVQVAQNKKFSKGKKTKVVAVSYYQHPTNCTFTKLKKGKTYYARVRTYKLVNGEKCYSSWSNVKTVKIKK